jgi:hypothetical protein
MRQQGLEVGGRGCAFSLFIQTLGPVDLGFG